MYSCINVYAADAVFLSAEDKYLLCDIKSKISYGWWFGFYGISTFIGYLMQNPFLYK